MQVLSAHASLVTAHRQPVHHDGLLCQVSLDKNVLNAWMGDVTSLAGRPFNVGRWRKRAVKVVMDCAESFKSLRMVSLDIPLVGGRC